MLAPFHVEVGRSGESWRRFVHLGIRYRMGIVLALCEIKQPGAILRWDDPGLDGKEITNEAPSRPSAIRYDYVVGWRG